MIKIGLWVRDCNGCLRQVSSSFMLEHKEAYGFEANSYAFRNSIVFIQYYVEGPYEQQLIVALKEQPAKPIPKPKNLWMTKRPTEFSKI